MSILKISGIVILLGSVCFLVAAFSPISRVFGLSNTKDKLAMITGDLAAWNFSQVLFALGAIVTVFGIALLAYALKDRPMAPLLFTAAALLAVGAAAWTWHTYLRMQDPAAFVNGILPGWHFVLYTLLTIAAFSLIGIALLRMGFPTLTGWLLIGGSLLFLALYIIFKDMPPFVHYLLGVALAIALLRGV